MYSTLKNCSKSNKLLQITPEISCNGGPYTWNEQQMLTCPRYTQEQYDMYTCSGVGPSSTLNGMYPATSYTPGTPARFIYTPLSDANWQNARCRPGPTDLPLVNN